MLWRMSADSRPRRLGVMSSHRIRKAFGEPPSRAAAGSHQPVPQTPTGNANCAIALSPHFLDPPYGAQELPVAYGPSRAISCRVVFQAGRDNAAANLANLGNLPNLRGRPAGRRHLGKWVAERAERAETHLGRRDTADAPRGGLSVERSRAPSLPVYRALESIEQ